MDDFEKARHTLAEARIREAIARGELDHLKGSGKPLNLDDGLMLLEPHERFAYIVMKNSGTLPEEVSLRKKIEELVESSEFHQLSGEKLKELAERIENLRLMENVRKELRLGEGK